MVLAPGGCRLTTVQRAPCSGQLYNTTITAIHTYCARDIGRSP